MGQLPIIDAHGMREAGSGLGDGAPASAAGTAWSAAEREQVGRELANAIRGEVRFGFHDRMLYATDASLYQLEPLGVVIPADVDDAEKAVAFCAAKGLPILPRGGGTSLAGQCTNRAVVIDFSPNCRAIKGIDVAERTCEIEPGITVDELNAAVAQHGLFFAPDPATSKQANIGGCIGNNAAGGRSILFGRTSESLIAVEALVPGEGEPRRVRLAAGSSDDDSFVRGLTLRVTKVVAEHAALIRERFPKTIRRNAGYNLDLILKQMEESGWKGDGTGIAQGGETRGTRRVMPLDAINLAHLVCGSEGTLAVTLGATLRLHPLPRAKGLVLAGFDSLDAAVEAVPAIVATGPSAVELVDDVVLDLARANPEHGPSVDLMPSPEGGPLKAVLMVEYFAHEDPRELGERIGSLMELLERVAPTARLNVCNAAEAARAWALRKAGEPLLHGVPGDRKPITFVEDNAVPVENLARFVKQFRDIVERHGTRASFWAHASVGVLHVRPFLDIRKAGDRGRMLDIAEEVADLAKSLGGVMSGEHGDGRARGPLLERFYGPELMGAFRQVKAIFDPRNLLNPGNIVEPGPVESITQNLRIEPGGHPTFAAAAETFFSYDDQHGLRGAVEMCNGAGVCRKKQGGTMCPSYMALLDERHSTRGRGNALRLAITGQLEISGQRSEVRGQKPGAGIWDDPETMATLDLCLSCKACKAECPSNVDIARLKAEYTAQRFREKRPALRDRVFGGVRRLNRLGSLMPGVSNWLGSRGFVRSKLDRHLGLAPKRSLPPFGRTLKLNGGSARAGAPRVALFGDCFTMYNEPEIAHAAARLLGAFGYSVELVDAGCCGRAKISTGLLPGAIREADRTLERLRSWVEDDRVAAIVVCEPSCLSAFRDDWLLLKMTGAIDLRRRLAAKTYLPEQFLDARWEAHPHRPEFEGGGSGEVVLHGHCHQKALWGIDSSAAMLRRVAGEQVVALDSGCCGMAGAFGYTADHYELSMRIGELVLFPAVRAAARGGTPGPAEILATGTSCRHQVRDGTGVMARHPVQWLADRVIG